MTDIIYETRIERVIGDVTVSAEATGRPDDRGEVTLRVADSCGFASQSMAPDTARELAAALIELADKAKRLTTRGFVGSTENNQRLSMTVQCQCGWVGNSTELVGQMQKSGLLCPRCSKPFTAWPGPRAS